MSQTQEIPMEGKQKLIKKLNKKKETNKLDLFYMFDKNMPFHAHMFIDTTETYSGVALKNKNTGEHLREMLVRENLQMSEFVKIPLKKLKKKKVLPLDTMINIAKKGHRFVESIIAFEEFDRLNNYAKPDHVKCLAVIDGKLMQVHKAKRTIGLGFFEITNITYFGIEFKKLFLKGYDKYFERVIINLLTN